MKPVRVGLLIASLSGGGAERGVLCLLDKLDAAGLDVFLLTLDRSRDFSPTGDSDRQDFLSQRIIRLSGADIHWNTICKILIAPWQWVKLEYTIRRLKLDVVLSMMERANILNLLTLSAKRRIISIHSYPSSMLVSKDPLKRGLIMRLYPHLIRRANRIVFISKEAAANFNELFSTKPGQCAVIYNVCDLDGLRTLAQQPIPGDYKEIFERPVAMTHARLSPEKGHWHLLRAFREVTRRNKEVQLVILGEGPLAVDLLQLSRDLQIQDRVFFPGFQPNPLPWVAKANLFILSSLREGLPNSLLEAMALGVPIIATDCRSGPRELLAPGTDPEQKTTHIDYTPCGLLTPPLDGSRPAAGDPLTRAEQLLAQAIERMLGDEKLQAACAQAAKQRASEFSPEKVIPHWLQLISEVLCQD